MTSIPAIFRALQKARVRYLLVGGYASVVHGVPRTTLDVDLALDPELANVGRALRRIGLEPETDRLDEILAQGGVTAAGDRSVDLLTPLPGVAFEDLWPRPVVTRFRGTRIPSFPGRTRSGSSAASVGPKTSRTPPSWRPSTRSPEPGPCQRTGAWPDPGGNRGFYAVCNELAETSK